MSAPCLCLWIALAGATFAESPSTADGLQWETDLATAQRRARETNRLVLIHFGGPWCEPCQTLEKQVFSRPGFGHELRARFVAVKIDPRNHADLAGKYQVRTVPSDVVIMPSGQMIYRVGSPTNAATYIETMNRVADSIQPLADTALASSAPVAETAAQQAAPLSDPTDRYADYRRGRQPAGNKPPEASQVRADQELSGESPHATAVSMRPQRPDSSVAGETRQPVSRPQPKTITPAARVSAELPPKAPGNPPMVLDGYCAVTLVEKRLWQEGDRRWGAIHRGRTYLFTSEEAQKTFLADPDRYSPVLSGNDPVMRLEHNQDVAGKREHGAFYKDRIYLFASEETFLRFDRDPARYTIENRQALRR